jgi:hypothetical protein
MNPKVQSIHDLAKNALKIQKQEIYLIFVRDMISTCKNTEIISVLEKIEIELQKSHSERTPREIWREHFQTQELFDLSPVDYHLLFYYEVKEQLDALFGDLFLNGKWKREQIDVIFEVKKTIQDFFNLDNFPSRKPESSFWWDSEHYAKWKDCQFMKIDKELKKEINRLNKSLEKGE